MARTSSARPVNRRTKAIAVLGVLVILVSLALPKLMTTDDGTQPIPRKGRREPAQQTDERLRDRVAKAAPASTRNGAASSVAKAAKAKPKGSAGRVDVEHVAQAADDLEVALSLRWESYPTGTAIQAQVQIANRDESPVWIPSPDEPQPTLAIRVLDEDGATVRRVVEEAADHLPRRMRRLGPGESATITLDVVAHGEAALPPGRYQLAAVFEADSAWLRSGLPVWTAPKGARHSGRVTFDVTER